MKRYGNTHKGDKTHRPGCPCCRLKYTHRNKKSDTRGGKKRERQFAKKQTLCLE